MILRSVGIAGAIVVGLAVAAALTLLPAILAIVGPRIDALAVRRVAVAPDGRRAVGAARAAGDAPPGRRPRPDPGAPAPARLAVPARPVQRPGRDDPAAVACPSRAAFDLLAGEFGEGEFAPLVARGPDDRRRRPTPANLAALYDYSRRLAADPRISRVDEPRRRRPAADARRSTSCCTAARTGRRTGSSRRPSPRRPRGDLTAFTVYTPVRPEPRRGRGRSSRDLRDPAGPLAPPAGVDGPRRRRRGGRRRRREPRRRRLPADRRCSSS